MLNKNSYLTQKLREYHFFWGGLWSPRKGLPTLRISRMTCATIRAADARILLWRV